MATLKASPAKSMDAQEAKWRAEDDLRVCLQYKEIMADPKRKAAMQKIAGEKLKALQAIKQK